MVDGTVPGWLPSAKDLHFDHHRPGGANIQIDEIDPNVRHKVLPDACFVTTQVDADACAAAAYLQLGSDVEQSTIDRLRAIAYDCDHLSVPPALSRYAELAACAVAVLKLDAHKIVTEFGLPTDRRLWSIEQKESFASEAFKRGTDWLVGAVENKCYWPGEAGEANEYWEKVEEDTETIIKRGLITMYRNCLIFDETSFADQYINYVDPRSWIKAVQRIGIKSSPITLTCRPVFVAFEGGEFKGRLYILGCIPFHPCLRGLDFTMGIFDALTRKERELNSHAEPWGGRRTVGGSGWNTPSRLSPREVIDTVLEVGAYLET